MDNSIFSTSFLTRIKTVLDENIEIGSGQCMTRTALAKELNLDDKFRLESAIGALVTSGAIEGYETRKGPGGGIGRVGERAEKKPAAAKPVVVTDEFKGQLMATLQNLCDQKGTPVPRKVIAERIGNDKALPMISAALQLPEFDEFETKIGKGGGVRRIVEPNTVGEDLASTMENNDDDNAVAL